MSVFKYVDVQQLDVRNPLIQLNADADNTFTDNRDIGFSGKYYNGTNVVYTGLFRDATDAKFKLFQSLQVAPDFDLGVVNTAGTGYSLASLDILDLSVAGNAVFAGNVTINGTTTTVNATTLTVADNVIIANSGPSQKEDAGFVVRRIPANIDDDTVKQSGTASAAGSTTTITLQATNGHGTLLDYYKGWIVKFGGDATGTSIVASSTAADPPVLTFAPVASAATSTSTTYQLFNKQYVGTIYDESDDFLSFMGFPREDLETTFTTNNTNGNLADYVNIKAKDVIATGAVNSATLNVTGATILQDLTVNGTFNYAGSTLQNTKTQVAAITFVAADIIDYDIIYLNPTANTTYTLPLISSVTLASNKSKITMFVNISNFRATISRNGSDTIEGTNTIVLRSLYSKTVLTISSELATAWTIKG